MLFCFRVSASHFDPYVVVPIQKKSSRLQFLASRYKRLRDERVVTLQMKCMEKLTIFSRRKTFVFFISSLLLTPSPVKEENSEEAFGEIQPCQVNYTVVSVISNNSSKKEEGRGCCWLHRAPRLRRASTTPWDLCVALCPFLALLLFSTGNLDATAAAAWAVTVLEN